MTRAKLPTTLLLKSILATALCLLTTASLHAQNPQQTGGDDSWTKTRDNAPQNANPSRTTESRTSSGNRTVDKQRIEVLSPNGGYQPASETETETIQEDANTTRTVVRTYLWNPNGQRTLARVADQESRTTAGGTHIENKISTSDVDGNVQLVRREVADSKTVSPGVEETKNTIYQRDSYGGFSQAAQTHEVTTHNADDTVAVKKTTLLPDGNGGWQVTGVIEKTIKPDGKDRTTDERLSISDINGNLEQRARTVTKEGETPTGEKTSTVEKYTVHANGYTDGGIHLSERVSTVQKKDSQGETTEQQISQPSYGNPSDGPQVTSRTKYVVKYAAPGSQQPTQATKTVETRDASGNFIVTSSETQKSTQPPPQAPVSQKPPAHADKPAEKPPVKP